MIIFTLKKTVIQNNCTENRFLWMICNIQRMHIIFQEQRVHVLYLSRDRWKKRPLQCIPQFLNKPDFQHEWLYSWSVVDSQMSAALLMIRTTWKIPMTSVSNLFQRFPGFLPAQKRHHYLTYLLWEPQGKGKHQKSCFFYFHF